MTQTIPNLVPYAYARITLAAPSGEMSSVIITSVGQIYVKKN
jgi:hypothetical protein